MKILLVSDPHHFSTKDVYDGYVAAFNTIGIDYDIVPIHEMVSPHQIHLMSMQGAYGLGLAKLLNIDNGFTHCVIISGLTVPQWFFKSKYDKKMCVIATDDPHASKILYKNREYIDHWFSNEKNLKLENVNYLPTATTHILPSMAVDQMDENLKHDVVFVGTVYKDREKILEKICRYCEKNNKKVAIYGPLLTTKKRSVLRKYAVEGILDNRNVKVLYRGAKVVINLDRNINWNPMEKKGNSTLIDVDEAYSMNPRSYEIAGCRATQLYVNARPEAKDVFGDNIYYANENNIVEELDKILNEARPVLYSKINNAYNIVKDSHTYINRALALIDYIK